MSDTLVTGADISMQPEKEFVQVTRRLIWCVDCDDGSPRRATHRCTHPRCSGWVEYMCDDLAAVHRRKGEAAQWVAARAGAAAAVAVAGEALCVAGAASAEGPASATRSGLCVRARIADVSGETCASNSAARRTRTPSTYARRSACGRPSRCRPSAASTTARRARLCVCVF